MQTLLGISVLTWGLALSACAPVQPEVSRSAVAQVQSNPATGDKGLITPPATPAHNWTCTASGAGMAGKCMNN
ncbi:hypothetical protein [Roseinatronobacter thiooxidans]|uniref:hypothetical protein n=1 Tax=Roseinatronobacter thiooxidans TaxID=121821 RepID=UPI0011606216|nr:hypothetical protein [Roseinatronobacter thiooxidans]